MGTDGLLLSTFVLVVVLSQLLVSTVILFLYTEEPFAIPSFQACTRMCSKIHHE